MEFKVGQLVKFKDEIFPIIGIKNSVITILLGSQKWGYNTQVKSDFPDIFGIDPKYIGQYVCRFGGEGAYLPVDRLTLHIKKRCLLCIFK